MGILDIGAGAAEGLEAVLARDRQQELLRLQQREQAEQERSARATEGFRDRQLQQQGAIAGLSAQMAGQARQQQEYARQQQEQNRVRDDARAELGTIPMGSVVPEMERDRYVGVGAGAPARFSQLDMTSEKIQPGTVQPDPKATEMGVPASLAQNEPQYELQGTPQELAARTREQQFDANQARLEAEARTRDAHMDRRLDIADTNAQRAQRGFAPRVIPTDQGMMLFDPNTGTFTPAGVGQAPTAATRDRVAAAGRVQPVMTAIGELSEVINTKFGPVAKMEGGIRRLEAMANMDDDVAEYMAVIKGFTPMVARAVGHTGVLTQQDVESVYNLFPMPGDSKPLRDRKIARVTGLLQSISNLEPGSADRAPAGTGASPTAKPSAADLIRKYGGGNAR